MTTFLLPDGERVKPKHDVPLKADIFRRFVKVMRDLDRCSDLNGFGLCDCSDCRMKRRRLFADDLSKYLLRFDYCICLSCLVRYSEYDYMLAVDLCEACSRRSGVPTFVVNHEEGDLMACCPLGC